MKITYPGPSVGVDLLGPNNETIRVKRGETIEVPDKYGKQLVAQGWHEVKQKPAKKGDE